MPEAETQSETPFADRFEAIENKVRDANSKDKLARAYAERGTLRSALGSDEEGLKDLLRSHALYYGNGRISRDRNDLERAPLDELLGAYKAWEAEDARKLQPSGEWCPDAELAETLRVYARDSLLSMPPGGDCTPLVETVISAVLSFERALLNLEMIKAKDVPPGSPRKARGWLYAHRASCYTLLFWMRRSTLGVPLDDAIAEELFRRADTGFTLALEELPEYVWALKFKAFLLALRGGPRQPGQMSDFKRARNMLKRVASLDPAAGGGLVQSSLQRSIAMLFSYDVGDVHEEKENDWELDGREAAAKCIEAAMTAIMEDPEDFLAAYFGVLGTWYMAVEQRSAFHQAALPSALRSAQVRARNAFSQALATLAGLEALQEQLATGSADHTFRSLLTDSRLGLDWETRAIFMRDPLTKFLVSKPRNSVRELFAIPPKLTEGVLNAIDRAHS